MATMQFPSPHKKTLPEAIKIVRPTTTSQDPDTLQRIVGSLLGLAVGDALGASVEFRPRQYLIEHPITDMVAGGTWGLKAGQWTDDTSMALCLASSLITQREFNPYDQLVRYKWWYEHGYLSSTGHCFDIGIANRRSLQEFYRRQKELKRSFGYRTYFEVDQLSHDLIKKMRFDVNCSGPGVAGNGALMRLTPVPLFFYRTPTLAVELSGQSARLTHGDDTAVDACRYYGALIVAAVRGESKEELLSDQFCHIHREWFGSQPLYSKIVEIANGSFKNEKGYEGGIRGKGHVVRALEAALWAFWSTESFNRGVLDAVNLGDDTDTTAAIYGQLAGAHYGYDSILKKWRHKVYAKDLIVCIAEWLQVLGPVGNEEPEKQSSNQNIAPSVDQLQLPSEVATVQPTQSKPTIKKQPKKIVRNARSKSLQKSVSLRSTSRQPKLPKANNVQNK